MSGLLRLPGVVCVLCVHGGFSVTLLSEVDVVQCVRASCVCTCVRVRVSYPASDAGVRGDVHVDKSERNSNGGVHRWLLRVRPGVQRHL